MKGTITKGTMTMKSILIYILAIAALYIGCEQKKLEPVPVGEMSEYKDPGYGFRIKYPSNWKQLGTTGKAVFAMSQDVIDKFQNPTTGIEGAMVTAEVIPFEGKGRRPYAERERRPEADGDRL